MVPNERIYNRSAIEKHPMGTILATKTCVATAAFIRIHFRDNGIIARLLEESNDLPHDSCIGDDEIANRGFADS